MVFVLAGAYRSVLPVVDMPGICWSLGGQMNRTVGSDMTSPESVSPWHCSATGILHLALTLTRAQARARVCLRSRRYHATPDLVRRLVRQPGQLGAVQPHRRHRGAGDSSKHRRTRRTAPVGLRCARAARDSLTRARCLARCAGRCRLASCSGGWPRGWPSTLGNAPPLFEPTPTLITTARHD